MAVQPSNPCPACNKKPDIPDDLSLAPPFSFLIASALLPFIPYIATFFCNHCGVKLEARYYQSNRLGNAPHINPALGMAVLPTMLPMMGMTGGVVKPLRVGEISSSSLSVVLWTPPTKKAFVSYSHKDDAFCHPFAYALKAEGFEVFFDNGSIGSGADWVQAIGKAIDECHFFIAVLTPDAWGSEWVERELNTAIAARRTIIPVLLKDTTVQGILRSVQWVDVRSQTPEQAAKLVAEAMKKAK